MDEELVNILIVDDDPIVLSGIGQELEEEGYKVSQASSGEVALKILEEGKADFDVLITDLVMGEVDGIEVLQKSKELSPDCMVMIFTGYGQLETAIKAIRDGVDDFMEKPGSPEERLFRVRQLVEKNRSMRKLKLYEDFLPVCCVCKKIRDDQPGKPGTGEWLSVEHYLTEKGKQRVTSSYCPECYEEEMRKMDD